MIPMEVPVPVVLFAWWFNQLPGNFEAKSSPSFANYAGGGGQLPYILTAPCSLLMTSLDTGHASHFRCHCYFIPDFSSGTLTFDTTHGYYTTHQVFMALGFWNR